MITKESLKTSSNPASSDKLFVRVWLI